MHFVLLPGMFPHGVTLCYISILCKAIGERTRLTGRCSNKEVLSFDITYGLFFISEKYLWQAPVFCSYIISFTSPCLISSALLSYGTQSWMLSNEKLLFLIFSSGQLSFYRFVCYLHFAFLGVRLHRVKDPILKSYRMGPLVAIIR